MQMNSIDLSSEGFAFIIKPNATRLQPFYYADNVYRYDPSPEARFKNLSTSIQDNSLVYTINNPQTKKDTPFSAQILGTYKAAISDFQSID